MLRFEEVIISTDGQKQELSSVDIIVDHIETIRESGINTVIGTVGGRLITVRGNFETISDSVRVALAGRVTKVRNNKIF